MTSDYYTVDYIDYENVQQRGEFWTQQDAWRFLSECDELGIPAGYPVKRKGKK